MRQLLFVLVQKFLVSPLLSRSYAFLSVSVHFSFTLKYVVIYKFCLFVPILGMPVLLM